MSSRIEEIQRIIDLAPGDPFPRYGLAMEHKNVGALEEARAAFGDLLARHPDYVPQYLMHGNLLRDLKDVAEARRVYALGIEVARGARNQHALGELQGALDALDDTDD